MNTATRSHKKKNVWKIAFLVLIGVELLFMIVLFAMVFFGGSASVPEPTGKAPSKSEALFSVRANKQQLENLINERMPAEKNSRLSYHLDIGDQLVLNGKYKLLFTAIPFSLTFTPEVSNGDIILKETDVRLGSVPLPDKEVLALLKSSADFPKWVMIRPNDRELYIKITDAPIQKGLYLRAQTIDLARNNISFAVYRTK